MTRSLRCMLPALCAFLIAPAFAADEKKKDDPKPLKVVEKKEAENKLIKAGEIAGELVHVEPTKNSMRVKVTIRYQELNQGAYKNFIQAQIDLRNARDINARNNALR